MFHPTRLLHHSAVVKRIIRPVKFSTFRLRPHFFIPLPTSLQLHLCGSAASLTLLPPVPDTATDGSFICRWAALHCEDRICHTFRGAQLAGGLSSWTRYYNASSQATTKYLTQWRERTWPRLSLGILPRNCLQGSWGSYRDMGITKQACRFMAKSGSGKDHRKLGSITALQNCKVGP